MPPRHSRACRPADDRQAQPKAAHVFCIPRPSHHQYLTVYLNHHQPPPSTPFYAASSVGSWHFCLYSHLLALHLYTLCILIESARAHWRIKHGSAGLSGIAGKLLYTHNHCRGGFIAVEREKMRVQKRGERVEAHTWCQLLAKATADPGRGRLDRSSGPDQAAQHQRCRLAPGKQATHGRNRKRGKGEGEGERRKSRRRLTDGTRSAVDSRSSMRRDCESSRGNTLATRTWASSRYHGAL